MNKIRAAFVLTLLWASPAFSQTRGVLVPIPDALARGLGVLEAVTGRDLLAPLSTVTRLRFGASGQLLFGGASSLFVAGAHHRLGAYRDDALLIDVRFIGGRFVASNLFTGLAGGYAAELFSARAQPSLGFVGPVGGYNIKIHDYASVLPLLALTYDTWRRPCTQAVRHHAVNVGLDVTFVMQLTEHLGLSLAPFVKQSVYHSVHGTPSGNVDEMELNKATWDTTYGVKAGLLGWL